MLEIARYVTRLCNNAQPSLADIFLHKFTINQMIKIRVSHEPEISGDAVSLGPQGHRPFVIQPRLQEFCVFCLALQS